MKLILFDEKQKWSERGYGADVSIFEIKDLEDDLIEEFKGSTWPNPFDPSDYNIKTSDAYGAIEQGLYKAQYLSTAHNNEKGFNIRDNGEIPTINTNPNQNGRMFADHVDIHSGYKDTWRGSAACLTIHPGQWDNFCDLFEEKENVYVRIERKYNEVS